MKPHALPLCLFLLASLARGAETPELVDLKRIDPTIVVDLAYAGPDNFMGRPAPGYEANKCLLTEEAAAALRRVQHRLAARGLGLKVRDCYRPASAVRYMAGEWLRSPDLSAQKTHYPAYSSKQQLFDQGFISADSGHARGSTVDLTLVRRAAGRPAQELEFGTIYDFFGREATWGALESLPRDARENRKLLREAMAPEFAPYDPEWWHFHLKADRYKGPMLEQAVR